jgi:putative phage-type endonuclease
MKVIAKTNELSRNDWLELRRKGIGGSDAGVIMGVSRWQSPYSLWANKRGLEQDNQAGEAAMWGNRLERSVAEAYAEQTGDAVVAWPVMLQGDEDWMLANVDFFISGSDKYEAGKVTDVDEEPERIEAILEIKTTGITGKASREWDNGRVPISYLYQGMHYCMVTKATQKTVFACLMGGTGLVIREREYSDSDLVGLYTAEKAFWGKVTKGTEPDITGHEADFDTLKGIYPASEGGVTIEADEFVKDLLEEYKLAKQTLDESQADVDAIRAQLLRIVGDAEAVTFDGDTLYTYKSTKDRESLDTKAFKEQLPDVYAQFSKFSPGHRTLRIKGE